MDHPPLGAQGRPVEGISDEFGAMYEWADRNGVRLGGWKVDHGYRPGSFHTVHELLIDIPADAEG